MTVPELQFGAGGGQINAHQQLACALGNREAAFITSPPR